MLVILLLTFVAVHYSNSSSKMTKQIIYFNLSELISLASYAPVHPFSCNEFPINASRALFTPKSLSPTRLELRNSKALPFGSTIKSSTNGFPPLKSFANVPLPELRNSYTNPPDASKLSVIRVYPPPSIFPPSCPP